MSSLKQYTHTMTVRSLLYLVPLAYSCYLSSLYLVSALQTLLAILQLIADTSSIGHKPVGYGWKRNWWS